MRRPRAVRPIVERSEFAGFRFPAEVITVAVRWYLRYGLSYRDVEELLVERGIEVDHVTSYRCSDWVRKIARRLDRTPSTISREVRRNLRPHDRDRYDADLAHARAAQRARRPRPGQLVLDGRLGWLVQAKPEQDWSPQQSSVNAVARRSGCGTSVASS